MRHTRAIVALAISVLASGASTVADKPWPRLEFKQVQGEWIGQVGGGDVFRLNLQSLTSGSIGYLRPQWDEGVTTYPVAEIEFDGVAMRILVKDRQYGKVVLSGLARENFMDLTIKGLYVRASPRIRFMRPDAWTGSLERLRAGMEP